MRRVGSPDWAPNNFGRNRKGSLFRKSPIGSVCNWAGQLFRIRAYSMSIARARSKIGFQSAIFRRDHGHQPGSAREPFLRSA